MLRRVISRSFDYAISLSCGFVYRLTTVRAGMPAKRIICDVSPIHYGSVPWYFESWPWNEVCSRYDRLGG